MAGGRPKANINKEQFEKLCGLQCTKEEICGWFGITDKTLDRFCKETYDLGFSEVFKQKREAGKISLRRAQFRLAEKSASMAIFLGKNYLGQKDTQELETNNSKVNDVVNALNRIAENNEQS
jgi:hypothetical protein